MASVFKRERDKGRKGACYYVTYQDQNGRRRQVKGCPDKAATEAMARKLESDARLRRSGVIDPKEDAYAANGAKPLADHMDEWHAFLIAKGGTVAHADVSRRRAARIVALIRGAKPDLVLTEPAGATRLVRAHAERQIAKLLESAKFADLVPSRVQTALAILRDSGMGEETINHHVRAIKGLSRWAWRDGRTREHILAHISTRSPEADLRRIRRAITPDESSRLIAAAEIGPKVKGMTGRDRAMLYRLAMGTGFRREELRSLSPASFRLDATPPVVICEAGYAKNGKRAEQPISAALAATLRPWLAGREAGKSVFSTMTKHRTAEMLRNDLAAAGIDYETDAGVCDFHSLRGVFISNLVASGASVKVCQQLARHSAATLTIGIYAKASKADLKQAVESLPDFGAKPITPPDSASPLCHREAFGPRRDLAGSDAIESNSSVQPDRPNLLPDTDLIASGRVLSEVGRAGIEPATPGFSVLYQPDDKANNGKGLQKDAPPPPPLRHRIEFDADLRAVIEAWPNLPDAIRAGIMALVRSSQPNRKRGGK